MVRARIGIKTVYLSYDFLVDAILNNGLHFHKFIPLNYTSAFFKIGDIIVKLDLEDFKFLYKYGKITGRVK